MSMEQRIRDAYARLVDHPGGIVRISAIRTELADVPAAQVTDAIVAMANQAGVHVRRAANQSTLTDADRDAAVLLGDELRHNLTIDDDGLARRIRAAYARHAAAAGSPVAISTITGELDDVWSGRVHAEVATLARQHGVRTRPYRPHEDEHPGPDDGVWIDGADHHLIEMDQDALGDVVCTGPVRSPGPPPQDARPAPAPGPQPGRRRRSPTSSPAGSAGGTAPEPASRHRHRAEPPRAGSGTDDPGSGETLDPAAAHTFAGQVRRTAEDLHTSIETSVTTLRARGVTGQPIELLARMCETAHALAVDAEVAERHFAAHLRLQDQVLADPTLAATLTGTYLGDQNR